MRPLVAVLSVLASVPVPVEGQASDTGWPRAGSVGLGISISAPGGPGATLDLAGFGPLSLRARFLGMLGTVARGAGLGIDAVRLSEVRLYATGLAGEVRCIGDPDTSICSNSPGSSFAWYAGGGFEFAIEHPIHWTFGIEVGRWFAQNGPTLDYGEQASRTMSAVLLRRYF